MFYYLVLDSKIIKQSETNCYFDNQLRPTQSESLYGVFDFERFGEEFIVHEIGNYTLQRNIINCETGEILAERAILINMGDINEGYYNKVMEIMYLISK